MISLRLLYDCPDVRPCPRKACRYHLGHAATRRGESCALDVADGGGATLEEMGYLLGLTRERIRQIEAGALVKLTRIAKARKL